jgi:hypothetical protein
VESRAPVFAMVGVELADHLTAFSARDLKIFLTLHLLSDAEGYVSLSVEAIEARTGLNRKTVHAALCALFNLRIGGKRILGKLPDGKFGPNRYVLFPDRDQCPFKVQNPMPEREARPTRFATYEEPEQTVSVPKNGTLQASQKTGHLRPQVSRKTVLSPYRENVYGEDKDKREDIYPVNASHLQTAREGRIDVSADTPKPGSPEAGCDTVSAFPALKARKPKKANRGDSAGKTAPPFNPCAAPPAARPEKTNPAKAEKRVPPARDTAEPKNAADLTALYIELYRAAHDAEPIMNHAAFGRRMKTALQGGTTAAELAEAIRFFFREYHPSSAFYASIGHSDKYLVSRLAQVMAFSQGGAAGRTLASDRRARAAGNSAGSLALSPRLRALSESMTEPGEEKTANVLLTRNKGRGILNT